ncbi:MAG: (2Fe-2S)-binding protein [Nitrosospira sp.]|nr:(2Fe-2S)-binding protein [Nitrosospira sp.]MDW7643174.1 (2Fe-2S)-binding protein [Nitrosomonadaceae bacterium]MDW7653192.1 (2Fe-2S)-binding protein [Nitrosomonadaceae bacterium]MDW7664215.1 (2Fe-2S)-binding protein [Nitrosomonadaceae bacterium]
MYICICKGITDTAIHEAVYNGADRMRDLKSCLGVTEQCGICATHVQEVLEKALMQRSLASNFFSKPTRLNEKLA